MSDRQALVVLPITTILALVEQLAELELTPLHLRIDAKMVGDTRPDVSMWMQMRTDFETFCSAIKAKPKEARYPQPGQRSWSAEHDTANCRLLVQVVSFEHHDDWQPREKS